MKTTTTRTADKLYPTLYRGMRMLRPGGREISRNLRELRQTQWLSPEELRAMQFAKIKQLLQHAFERVPYYRRLYQRLDIHPGDVKSLGDFQQLPLLTKQDINNHLDDLVASTMRNKVRLSRTGGSTGEPMQFYITDGFWWCNSAVEIRGRSWYGLWKEPGAR